ncbi:hypothetical protein U1Q18_048551 [Sarracenia purpurea var. burkii]
MYPVGLEYPRRRTTRKKNKFPQDTVSSSNSASNFTSLPPVNLEDVNCNQKRRFSDPGLNNVDESNEASTESSDVDEYDVVNDSLLEQISELKSENKRLVNDLKTTKDELNIIKSEISAISSKISCHEPLSLAQMVKEIRDAAQIRENVLFSKTEALIERNAQSSDIKVSKKEDSTNLDLLNPDVQETSSDFNGNSPSTVSCESLSSSLGPGSLHSAHVTLCGPVTDL